MAQLITDARYLLQFMAAEISLEIPIQLGSQILHGRIVNYEDSRYATLQVVVYELGPPLRARPLSRAWPWDQVHLAVRDNLPLIWF